MEAATFEQLCQDHRQALLAYAYTCSRDLHLAEDIVQEALLIALRKREHYFPDADFGAWLIAIARNVWFRERERRGIRERASRYLHDHAAELFEAQHYEPVMWERERAALRRCLSKLGDGDRSLITAHFSGGEQYQTIADRLSRTLSWVKVRMFRLRAALLTCVKDRLSQNQTDGAP
jgi:RNA polymerase sigma-70 factor, ECF subfamily